MTAELSVRALHFIDELESLNESGIKPEAKLVNIIENNILEY